MEPDPPLVLRRPIVNFLVRGVVVEDDLDFFVWRLIGEHAIETEASMGTVESRRPGQSLASGAWLGLLPGRATPGASAIDSSPRQTITVHVFNRSKEGEAVD